MCTARGRGLAWLRRAPPLAPTPGAHRTPGLPALSPSRTSSHATLLFPLVLYPTDSGKALSIAWRGGGQLEPVLGHEQIRFPQRSGTSPVGSLCLGVGLATPVDLGHLGYAEDSTSLPGVFSATDWAHPSNGSESTSLCPCNVSWPIQRRPVPVLSGTGDGSFPFEDMQS